MPKRDQSDLADALAHKAEQDATAVRELVGNPLVADVIVGFHAQQAIEKWLKSALARRGIGFERTHDLYRLLELIGGANLAMPVEADAISALTDYAVPFRYDDPFEEEALDRQATLDVVNAIGEWVRGVAG